MSAAPHARTCMHRCTALVACTCVHMSAAPHACACMLTSATLHLHGLHASMHQLVHHACITLCMHGRGRSQEWGFAGMVISDWYEKIGVERAKEENEHRAATKFWITQHLLFLVIIISVCCFSSRIRSTILMSIGLPFYALISTWAPPRICEGGPSVFWHFMLKME